MGWRSVHCGHLMQKLPGGGQVNPYGYAVGDPASTFAERMAEMKRALTMMDATIDGKRGSCMRIPFFGR